MHERCTAAFSALEGAQLVVLPQCAPDAAPDRQTGAVPFGCVHSLDEAETAARFFQLHEVDGLIVCPLDFGDERSAAKVAEKCGKPVLLFATTEPPARDDGSLGRVSDSYCGTLSIASALYRRKLKFRFAGIHAPQDPAMVREAQTFVQALAVVTGLRNARIGQVGVRPGTFETVGYDEAALIGKFGQNVLYRELSDIVDRARSLGDDDAETQSIVAQIAGEVGSVTVGRDYLVRMARLERAFSELYAADSLSALAIQCWPSMGRLMDLEPCALFGRLTARGMLTACEADVVGALSMIVSHRSALEKTLPHFIDWTIRHREDDNRFLAWHCGNAPACLAADKAQAALRSRRDMKGEKSDGRGALYQFQIKPGEVTICRLAEYDNRWKMLIVKGVIEPSDETLAGTWSWVRVADHDRLYRTLVEQGFIHHASMIHGDQTAALEEACGFMDIETVKVE